MKKLFLFILLLVSTVAVANWTSGGGDPKVVEALEFPHKKRLKSAIDFLKQRVDQTQFSENFKQAFKQDLSRVLKPK